MNLGEKLKAIFNPRPIANYVSDVDTFLKKFDETHEKSAAQLREIEKHETLAKQRDMKS